MLTMFEAFRCELDTHHDRRERVIKASRDITAASKKIIFTLQRSREINKPLPENIVTGNKPYYKTISSQLTTVSPELRDLNTHRYARNISGGSQEYMEAASFEHYLTTGNLISYTDAAEKLKSLSAPGVGIELSPEDYVLGIYDMTGELMRFAITTMASTGQLPQVQVGDEGSPRDILSDLHLLRSRLESLNPGTGPFAKDVEKKMEVMQASVEKVERAVYGLVIRGAERPKGWMPDLSGAGRGSGEVEV